MEAIVIWSVFFKRCKLVHVGAFSSLLFQIEIGLVLVPARVPDSVPVQFPVPVRLPVPVRIPVLVRVHVPVSVPVPVRVSKT